VALAAPPRAAIQDGLERLERTLETDHKAGQTWLKDLVGELTLTPVEMPCEPGKGESRSTRGYQIGGSLFLPAILIPLTSSGSECPSVVAGAGFEPATFGL
jgi:hypothetical protein